MSATIQVLRQGDTTKVDPFTVCFVANPVLELPEDSGNFVEDPIVSQPSDFDACVAYAVDNLFGDLAGQREQLLGPPDIRNAVRMVSLFVPGLPAQDVNCLVAGQDLAFGDLIICRRSAVRPFLSRFGLDADLVFAVTGSTEPQKRATAWATTDDDSRPGVPFTLDGRTFSHRHYALVPGTVALHVDDRDMTPLHELQHALGSFTNGFIEDLYHPNLDPSVAPVINKRRGRPIPANFAVYNGTTFRSDPSRDGLGYGTWRSYHGELHFPSAPAVMDDYTAAPPSIGALGCENDRITRAFLQDRIRAKINR